MKQAMKVLVLGVMLGAFATVVYGQSQSQTMPPDQMKTMAEQMRTMSDRMRGGKMTPEQTKMMGDHMQMMADRMKSGQPMTPDEMKAMKEHMQTMNDHMKDTHGMKGMGSGDKGSMKGHR